MAAFALLNCLFHCLLGVSTARRVMDRIEGLQMHLRTAETPRLILAGAPEISAERFERLLPSAIALDAEAPWSEAFECAFARTPRRGPALVLPPDVVRRCALVGRSLGSAVSASVAAAQASFVTAMPAPSLSSSGLAAMADPAAGGEGAGHAQIHRPGDLAAASDRRVPDLRRLLRCPTPPLPLPPSP